MHQPKSKNFCHLHGAVTSEVGPSIRGTLFIQVTRTKQAEGPLRILPTALQGSAMSQGISVSVPWNWWQELGCAQIQGGEACEQVSMPRSKWDLSLFPF